MNRDEQFQLFKEFIEKCTANANSVKNYSDFKRINECLQQLFPERPNVSILDFDDSQDFENVVNKLDKLESYIDFNSKGKNQYSTTVNWYRRFLNAKKLFSKKYEPISFENKTQGFPLQQIFYGAPGTGKSYKVKSEKLAGVPEENIFRTTFHPDYDYASFVGCYKPTKNPMQVLFDFEQMVPVFKKYMEDGVANGIARTTLATKFGYEYHNSLVVIDKGKEHTLNDIFVAAGQANSNGDTNMRAGIAAYESFAENNSSITYSFIPQVFTKAYIKAWEIIAKDEKVMAKVKKEDGTETEQEIFKPVYLVIEEINRGNCAQIFGDIFQLLDRNESGYSEYPIDIDEDLKNYLVQELGADSEGVKDGKLCLPPNLNLLATMNTSDQSLFPMDSAFKRRWDWEFVPIRYTAAEAKDGKDNFHTFTITIGDKDKGNVSTYLWTDFLQKVNAKILSVTDSEDKQMGEYFIKKSINQNEFINKVMYYLWSEVGKDMYNTTNALFTLPEDYKDKDGKAQNQFSFNELFKDNAIELLIGFMKKLEVKSEEEKAEATEAGEE